VQAVGGHVWRQQQRPAAAAGDEAPAGGVLTQASGKAAARRVEPKAYRVITREKDHVVFVQVGNLHRVGVGVDVEQFETGDAQRLKLPLSGTEVLTARIRV
jgi:hypothetical protein